MELPLLARLRAVAGGILLAALFSACDADIASFDAPLPATEGAEVDNGVSGGWVAHDSSAPDGLAMLFVEKAEGETLDVKLIWTAYDPEDTDHSNEGLPFMAGKWRVSPSVIGGRTYYSGQFLSYDDYEKKDRLLGNIWAGLFSSLAERQVYHIARAEIAADGRLTLYLLTEPDIEPLDFAYSSPDPVAENDLSIRADPERLRDFIGANADGDIFSFDLGPFVRISEAPSPDAPAEVPAEAPEQ